MVHDGCERSLVASPLFLDFAIITGLEQRVEVSTDGGRTFEREDRSSGVGQETVGLFHTGACWTVLSRQTMSGMWVLHSLASLLSAGAAGAASPFAATLAKFERSVQMESWFKWLDL